MISYLFVLNGRVSHFPILGKNFPQFHLIIIRECLQNSIALILRYFYNFPLIPFIQTPLTALIYTNTHTHIHTHTHTYTHREYFPQYLIIKECLVFVQYRFSSITFSMNIPVFSSFTIKRIFLDILKFSKGKFSHMRC